MKSKIFTFLLFLIGFIAQATPPQPPSGGGPPDCWPPPCVPIDGGISLLIAAGAVYGGKKLYDYKKEKNSL